MSKESSRSKSSTSTLESSKRVKRTHNIDMYRFSSTWHCLVELEWIRLGIGQ